MYSNKYSHNWKNKSFVCKASVPFFFSAEWLIGDFYHCLFICCNLLAKHSLTLYLSTPFTIGIRDAEELDCWFNRTCSNPPIKGQFHEIFYLVFILLIILPPRPQIIPLSSFQFLPRIQGITTPAVDASSKLTIGVVDTSTFVGSVTDTGSHGRRNYYDINP
jgi:hypothetical protein